MVLRACFINNSASKQIPTCEAGDLVSFVMRNRERLLTDAQSLSSISAACGSLYANVYEIRSIPSGLSKIPWQNVSIAMIL